MVMGPPWLNGKKIYPLIRLGELIWGRGSHWEQYLE